MNKIPVKPVEYARQLKKLRDSHPELSLEQIAGLVGKDPTWVKDTLNLLLLNPEYQDLVDSDGICKQNGIILSHVQPEDQDMFLKAAIKLCPREFTRIVMTYLHTCFQELGGTV